MHVNRTRLRGWAGGNGGCCRCRCLIARAGDAGGGRKAVSALRRHRERGTGCVAFCAREMYLICWGAGEGVGYGLLCTEQLQKVAWAEHSQCFFLLPLKIRKKILPGRAAQIFLIKIFKILALANRVLLSLVSLICE